MQQKGDAMMGTFYPRNDYRMFLMELRYLQAEYENLKAMGGNGTAEKLMKEVDQLPTRPMEEI